MKRIYVIIGSALLAIGLIAMSIAHWDTKVETTTEKAKKELKVVAKTAPELTGDVRIGGNKEDNGADSNSSSAVSNGSAATTEAGTGAENNGSTNSVTSASTGTSLEEIKTAYRDLFQQLEVQEMSKVDQLIVKAKADYVSEKYSKSDLEAKYLDAATLLEQNTDKIFNTIYKQLQIDLARYGHDTNEAEEFKTEYQTKKQERFTHAMNQLNNF